MELKVLENLKRENVEIYLEYLNSCKSSNWETWETTYKTYCNNFKLFLVWFQKTYKNRLLLSKDTLLEMPSIMESYRNYCRVLGNSKRTIMNKTTSISTFYAWCVRRNKIKYHPFDSKLDRLRFTEKDKIRKSYFLTTEQILTVRLYMQVESKKYDLQDRINSLKILTSDSIQYCLVNEWLETDINFLSFVPIQRKNSEKRIKVAKKLARLFSNRSVYEIYISLGIKP